MVTAIRPAWRPSWKFFVPFVVLHSLVSVLLTIVAFSQGMARFDSGAEPTFVERAVEFLSVLLMSPIFTLVTRSRALSRALDAFPGLFGYIPVIANSVLWAFLAWWLMAFLRAKSVRRARG